MIGVKICGITNPKDALCAAENGAAAVGLIFYPPSPRCVNPFQARAAIAALPDHVVRVGVFVNEDEARVQDIYESCGLDMIQLHGDEPPEYCRRFAADRLIKAFALKTDKDLGRVDDYEVAAILVDTRHAGLYGGTGKTSDWELAKRVSRPLILSGGLKEENAVEAFDIVRPGALDLNSGVEISPGRKDPEKIQRVMQKIAALPAAGGPRIFTKRTNR